MDYLKDKLPKDILTYHILPFLEPSRAQCEKLHNNLMCELDFYFDYDYQHAKQEYITSDFIKQYTAICGFRLRGHIYNNGVKKEWRSTAITW